MEEELKKIRLLLEFIVREKIGLKKFENWLDFKDINGDTFTEAKVFPKKVLDNKATIDNNPI